MKVRFIISAFTIIFIFFGLNLHAASSEEIVLGTKVKLNSEILNEERIVDIYVPEGYEAVQTKYPVLYLLDGENHFTHGLGITYFLSRYGLVPELIIVAIENVDRSRDFTPTNVEARPTSGGEEKFSKFISEELMKYIEENYRTINFNILFGHSLGGMYAFYSMLERPGMFDAYIAASPHLMWDNNYVLKLYEEKFSKADMKKGFMFFSIGDEPEYMDAINQMQEILSSNEAENFIWDFKKYDDDTHMTTTHKTLYDGLEYLYIDWTLPAKLADAQIDEIVRHYDNLSKRFGYDVKVPENIMNMLGYQALNQNNYELALERFKKNIELYPNSANVYDSIGEAYERMGEDDEALENYRKAYETAREINHPLTATFKTNYERMKNKN